jgi:hypothetical protein
MFANFATANLSARGVRSCEAHHRLQRSALVNSERFIRLEVSRVGRYYLREDCTIFGH